MFGTKPLFEQKLNYYHLNHKEQASVRFVWKSTNYNARKLFCLGLNELSGYIMSHQKQLTDTIGLTTYYKYPDSKVHGDNMGPTWGRQDPGGPHVGHVNLAIWVPIHKWGTHISSLTETARKEMYVMSRLPLIAICKQQEIIEARHIINDGVAHDMVSLYKPNRWEFHHLMRTPVSSRTGVYDWTCNEANKYTRNKD